MNTLGEEVERIKSELADLGCYMTFGMSCSDLVKKIYANVIQKQENKRFKIIISMRDQPNGIGIRFRP